jgi:hypothetical protein
VSLSVVILTGVCRRDPNKPLTVSCDAKLSAPELAVDACRSGSGCFLVKLIVAEVLKMSPSLIYSFWPTPRNWYATITALSQSQAVIYNEMAFDRCSRSAKSRFG